LRFGIRGGNGAAEGTGAGVQKISPAIAARSDYTQCFVRIAAK
jgi:hypothetical protein